MTLRKPEEVADQLDSFILVSPSGKKAALDTGALDIIRARDLEVARHFGEKLKAAITERSKYLGPRVYDFSAGLSLAKEQIDALLDPAALAALLEEKDNG